MRSGARKEGNARRFGAAAQGVESSELADRVHVRRLTAAQGENEALLSEPAVYFCYFNTIIAWQQVSKYRDSEVPRLSCARFYGHAFVPQQ
jgi:hypothetical protein